MVVVAAVLLGGCVRHPGLPPTGTSGYQAKVELSADAAISTLATTRLGLDAEARDHTTARYLEVLVSDQEDALDAVVGSFGSITPPTPEARRLREQFQPVLSEAQDHLVEVRIALDSGAPDEAVALRTDLDADLAALEAFGSS